MIKTTGFTTHENIDLLREISLVAPLDTPLLTMMLNKGQHDKATATTVTWREKTLDTTADITFAEGSATTTFQSSTRAEKSNVTEIFKKACQISGSALASDVVGIADLLQSEVSDRLKEMAVNIENKLTNGVYDDASISGVRKMKGLTNFVPASNTVTKGSLTEDNFKATVKKLWDNGLASGHYIALVNADLKEEIDDLYKDKYNYVAQENVFGLVVDVVNTNYGRVYLVLDRHVADDEILICDMDYIRLGILRNPQFEPLAKNGDYVQGQVVGELTLKVLNESAVAKFVLDATPPTTYTLTFDVNKENATIVVEDINGDEIDAEEDGTYELVAGAYSYTVSLDEYQTQTGTVAIIDKDVTIDITLIQ